MDLRSEIQNPRTAGDDLLRSMFALLDRHFGNVTWEGFVGDLLEKDWIILLYDESGELAGFSTQMLREAAFEGKSYRAVFSGDTIVAPEHWGSLELQLTFARLLERLRLQRPESPLYWFLISKGFRTYRLLPLYFKEFYPCHFRETPAWERRLLTHLAEWKFPGAYDAEKGILCFGGKSQFLKPPWSAIPEGRLESNPHVRFFANRNPGFTRGDELACLAEFRPENLSGFILKRLEEVSLQGV